MPQPRRIMLFGLPVRTSWTWMAVAACMTLITFSQLSPPRPESAGWFAGAFIILIGAIASILLHELAHVLAARRLGSNLASIEPSILGALPDTNFPAVSPKKDLQVALAGPLANLPIAVLLFGIWLIAGAPEHLPGASLLLLAGFNAGLVAIGLLPGYPFDGGRIFRAFIWFITGDIIRATRITAIYGHVLLFLGLLGGVVLLSVGEKQAVWGTWILILCWTVNRARHQGISHLLWTEAGKNLQIDDLFQAGVNRVPAGMSIDQSIESLLDSFRRGPTLVTDQQDVIGIVSLSSVKRVPRARWTTTPIGSIMTTLESLPVLPSDAPVSALLAELPPGSPAIVLVEKQGKIVAAANRDFVMDRIESYIRAERFNRRQRRALD